MPADNRDSAFGEIWLGDLLRAVAHANVGSDSERVAWAIEFLGLEPDVFELAEASRAAAGGAEHASAPRPPGENVDAGPKLGGRRRTGRTVAYEITRQHSPAATSTGMPAWYDDATELAPAAPAHLDARPPFRPLFRPGTTRALLSTSLATPSGEGDIDLGVIIDAIVRMRPISTLPRKRLSSLRLGIQLLVDRGQGMRPFAADRDLLLDDIRAVVGRDRMELLYFADTPLRQVDRGDRYGHRFAYEAPPAGTPVVVLSDLGLAGRGAGRFGASAEEWLKFARLVRGAECPLLALTPYGAHRWPRTLSALMHILPWDRSTNVSAVRRVIGHGLEVKGAR